MRKSAFFELCKAAAPREWPAFTEHGFVAGLGSGDLPQAAFRYYLQQDYLFLLNFSRAYALAVYKSEELDDMRQAAATMDALLNHELKLHLEYCRGWGLSEVDLLAVPEDPRNLAYTRYVLERGMAGDLLDLLVALAPCVLGYGEIGARLLADPMTRRVGNSYLPWIETYGGKDYQKVCSAALGQLDRVAERRLGLAVEKSGRWPALLETFRTATRLEIGFWDMGLDAAGAAMPRQG